MSGEIARGYGYVRYAVNPSVPVIPPYFSSTGLLRDPMTSCIAGRRHQRPMSARSLNSSSYILTRVPKMMVRDPQDHIKIAFWTWTA
eukprot:1237190-Karenia_brevis.AAC.1